MTTPLTGDIKNRVEVKKEGVTLHNFPIAPQASAAALSNIINDKSQSGKRLGGQVMLVDSVSAITRAGLYVAAGEDPDSNWVLVQQVVGTGSPATITPA